MVEHRKVPGSSVAVPAGWVIALSLVAVVGAGGWLGVMLVDPTSASADDAPRASSTPRAQPSPSDEPTTAEPTATTASPEPTETQSTETESTEPPVERDVPVSVLNNTGIRNLAASYSAKVSAAGWTVAAVGNWRGQIESNTVYFPGNLRPEAELLASDLDFERVMPSIVPMRMDRLTVILSGPQQ